MSKIYPSVLRWVIIVSIIMAVFLVAAMLIGLSVGSAGSSLEAVLHSFSSSNDSESTLDAIIWKIRFPRILLAAMVGAALSLGGLVFQALLRNPLAEPYILGISGGSAAFPSRFDIFFPSLSSTSPLETTFL